MFVYVDFFLFFYNMRVLFYCFYLINIVILGFFVNVDVNNGIIVDISIVISLKIIMIINVVIINNVVNIIIVFMIISS